MAELRRRLQTALRIPSMRAHLERPSFGGQTRQTRLKLANKLETLLSARFTPDACKQALYEHAQRHPHDFSTILNQNVTLGAFEQLCQQHPDWLTPIQRNVVECIQAQWTLAVCLSLHIHCKVGAQEKYQHMINLLAKVFNEETKKWEHLEVLSGVKMPKLPSKNQVLRTALIATSLLSWSPY